MKTKALASAASLAALLGLAACNQPAPSTVRDTGNMAYPAPLPQGNVATTNTLQRTPDTGSVAFPAPLPQGQVGTTRTGANPRRPTDTGNMAYPAPLPQGQVGTTTLSR